MAFSFLNFLVQTKDEAARAIDEKVSAAIRPIRGWGSSVTKSQEVLFQTAALGQLYDYAQQSDTYRTIICTIQRELFRNGGEWHEKFGVKCATCSKEYEAKPDKCSCGSTGMREPDASQKTTFDEFLVKANMNGHPLLEVCEHMEPDLEVLDNAFLVLVKRYFYGPDGEITSGQIVEMLRADPLYMRKIVDMQGRPGYNFENGLPSMVCPEHRGYEQNGKARCGQCGRRLYPAHFKTWNVQNTVYYFAGECIHLTKYTKTLYYGFPPALTILKKVQTLLAMDNMMNRSYYGQKTPKGLFLLKTSNVDSASKEWEAFLDRSQKDPYGIYPMFMPTSQNDTGEIAKFIEFMRAPEEMQYIETRTEIKQTIGALFGVMPIFQADLSTSSGLNNEGLTITVTTRAIESGQKVYNEKVFPFLLAQFGITDWEYRLKPPEEKDEMAEKQREAQETANAEAMKRMGFLVELTPDGKFKYSDKPEEAAQDSPPTPGFSQAQPAIAQANASRLDGQPQATQA
jgi:uncharacterized OB-fold protein